jgi:hypothetical protein
LERGTFRAAVEKAGVMMAGEVMVPTTEREISDVRFIIPGVPTSANPVTAFRQGMHGEREDVVLPVTAWRCVECGLLVLYAREEPIT